MTDSELYRWRKFFEQFLDENVSSEYAKTLGWYFMEAFLQWMEE